MEIVIFVLIIISVILTTLEKTTDFKCNYLMATLYTSLIFLSLFNLVETRKNIVNNNTNNLIVTSIKINDNNKKCKYNCKFYTGKNKYSESTIRYRFYDEIGKFNIGDTLKIVKK